MSVMPKVGDMEFDNVVLHSDRLTLVDFGAEWCGPCKKLHPIMEQLAGEYGEKIRVVEVDIESSPNVAVKYGVTSIPQLMFVQDGVVRETVVGLLPKSKIMDKIENYLV